MLLAGLAGGAFVVARVAMREQLTALGLQGAVLLANELRSRRPAGRSALNRLFASFEADGVTMVVLVNPERRVVVSNRAFPHQEIEPAPLLDEALRTGEVQAGWQSTGASKVFRVYVPVDRIPGPRWRHHPLSDPPEEPIFGHPLPPEIVEVSPQFPPGWGIERGRVILVLDVETDRAAWIWRWAWIQSAVSVCAIALLWLSWYGARRSAQAIAALEAEKRRRETLTRLGEMSAVLAHEVRNPLASLKGHLQLASEETSQGLALKTGTDGFRTASTRIAQALEETARIESLIRGLLDYTRDSRPHIESMPAEDLFGLARDAAGPWPEGVDLIFATRAGLVLHADRDEMARALANLLRNAAEAAGRGGKVRVSATVEGGWYRVTVEDSGPGVADDLRARMFEPFVTGKVRGVGLGLAVARKAIEAHGGRIEAGRSVDLGGARFDILWPSSEGGT